MRVSRIRLSSIGGNGFKMLLLSLLLATGTAGISLLAAQWQVWRVARRTGTQPPPCRQLLVLGMQLERGECNGDYRARLERGAELLETGRGQSLFTLGGVTSRNGPSEAAAGRDYLLRRGCPPDRLHLEEHSRHTLENLQRVRELLGDELDCVIVTSRYHLARTAAMARGMGMQHRLCAAEASLPFGPASLRRILQEGVLLHWYYTGLFWAKLVRDHKSLERLR